MSKINDGGPAFPLGFQETEHGDEVIYVGGSPGMSLRDWIAGKALAGICANRLTPWSPDVADIGDGDIASACYDLADAMLKAREET